MNHRRYLDESFVDDDIWMMFKLPGSPRLLPEYAEGVPWITHSKEDGGPLHGVTAKHAFRTLISEFSKLPVQESNCENEEVQEFGASHLE